MRKYTFLLVLSIFILSNINAQNVGIGTNAPSAKLDVNGNLRIRTIPQGALADSYLTVDADGNIKKHPLALQNIVLIDRGLEDQTHIGEPGSLYQFNDPVENPEDGYAIWNDIPGATITREYIPEATETCLGVRVPPGVYQLTMTYTGYIPYIIPNEGLPIPPPDFFGFFYSIPGSETEYGKIYNTAPARWGFRGSISQIIWVGPETRFLPFNLGWGPSESSDAGREIILSGAQLSLIQLR